MDVDIEPGGEENGEIKSNLDGTISIDSKANQDQSKSERNNDTQKEDDRKHETTEKSR